MDILLICTTFFPDTAISAVRSYMLADRLAKLGHNVTVLRSGEFENRPFDDDGMADMSFELISALGKNSDAEKYMRGEYVPAPAKAEKYPFLPPRVKTLCKAARDTAKLVIKKKPPNCVSREVKVLHYQKKVIQKLSQRRFDVVFSTYGWLENIYAGGFAKELFGCKWIMDFRDFPLVEGKLSADLYWYKYEKAAMLYALKNADCITAVSDGLVDELKNACEPKRIYTLRNGFDDERILDDVQTCKEKLTFCYTGRCYESRYDSMRFFVFILARLIRQGRLDRDKVGFIYAGSDSQAVKEFFDKFGICDVLTDAGSVSRDEALRIQLESDIYTVLSWNTKKDRGIMTGKFYEGIKAGKPIIAVVSGDTPNSELWQLQKNYNYGCCCEICTKQAGAKELERFILNAYNEKMKNGRLSYRPSKELYDAFCYTTIAHQLNDIMHKLVETE